MPAPPWEASRPTIATSSAGPVAQNTQPSGRGSSLAYSKCQCGKAWDRRVPEAAQDPQTRDQKCWRSWRDWDGLGDGDGPEPTSAVSCDAATQLPQTGHSCLARHFEIRVAAMRDFPNVRPDVADCYYRLRTSNWRASGPPDPSHAYHENQPRELSLASKQKSPNLKSTNQDWKCWPSASEPWHGSAIW